MRREEKEMEYFDLNDGTRIPAAGIGTYLLQPAEAEASVLAALSAGIRLVDTANIYLNEKAVGRAVCASGIPREDIYISTKLWPSIYDDADRAIDRALRRLGTDYVDMLFLHQPSADYRGAYKAMERAVRDGRVRSLGLSNFTEENVRDILEMADVMPAMVQVEAHPYYPQTALKAFLAPHGIRLMAWYPLGHGDSALMSEPAVTAVARRTGKTAAQALLRWHVDAGNVVIPGSKNAAHVRENADIFDFRLTDAEMDAIAALDKNERYYHQTAELLANYPKLAPDFDAQE